MDVYAAGDIQAVDVHAAGDIRAATMHIAGDRASTRAAQGI